MINQLITWWKRRHRWVKDMSFQRDCRVCGRSDVRYFDDVEERCFWFTEREGDVGHPCTERSH